MASHQNPSTKKRVPAPRRTRTIGVRLTAVEIEALDRYIAAQSWEASRAGTLAYIATERLIAAGLLRHKQGG